MTPDERDDAKVRSDLQALARHVDRQLPFGWGFVVLAFPYGEGGRMNYVSSTTDRGAICRVMYEFIQQSKNRFGDHITEPSSDDPEIAQLRQRVAELEGLLKEAVDFLRTLNETEDKTPSEEG
jgi:hypothetical protein